VSIGQNAKVYATVLRREGALAKASQETGLGRDLELDQWDLFMNPKNLFLVPYWFSGFAGRPG
jgi:hypothetical protein